MDIDLAVSARATGDHVAVQINGENILHRDLVEPDAMRLHEKQVWIIRKTKRNVSAGKVVLAFGDKHFPGHDQLLFDGSVSCLLNYPVASTKSGIRAFAFGHCPDRKSTRLNSSHTVISYAVFCLKKKN